MVYAAIRSAQEFWIRERVPGDEPYKERKHRFGVEQCCQLVVTVWPGIADLVRRLEFRDGTTVRVVEDFGMEVGSFAVELDKERDDE